ncbi:MAG: DUF5660 family protein [Nanoarchaeota archaeon]
MNKTIVRKRQQYINNNTIESQRSIGGTIVQQLSDTAKGMVSDGWSQLLGPMIGEKGTAEKTTGDLTEGQELILSDLKTYRERNKEKSSTLRIEPGFDYTREVLYGYKKVVRENNKEVSRMIQEILTELKRLIVASDELKVEFKEIAIEQRVVSPGKYHLNFFEWVLSAIRLARMKVEDSSAWLSVSKSKKAKREYWAMFKKHGTTFGLSNERVVATQTG